MRKTIKQLENDLEHAKKSRDDYYTRWQKLEDEKKERQRNEMFRLEEQTKQFISLTETLREIIRWQINPETARTPFNPLFKEGDKNLDINNRRFN